MSALTLRPTLLLPQQFMRPANEKIIELEEILASTRIHLQQAIEEKEAAQYELKAWQNTFRPAGEDPEVQTVMRIWLRCLGDKCAPKSHLIDGLAITTRKLMEYWNRSGVRL